MQFSRDAIIDHIRHVHAGGLVEEAVFSGRFDVQALTLPGTVLVLAGALSGAEPLPHPIGLGDLGRFLRALEKMTSDESDVTLSLDVDAGRIALGTSYGGALSFRTLLPETVGTQILPETVAAIWSGVAGAASIPLTQTLAQGILRSIPVVDASVVTICARPSRSWIVVGSESRSFHRFPFPFHQLPVVEPFDVTLEARQFATLLQQIRDFGQSELLVSGPDGCLALREGSYRYVVSPVEIDRPAIVWPIRSGPSAGSTRESSDGDASQAPDEEERDDE